MSHECCAVWALRPVDSSNDGSASLPSTCQAVLGWPSTWTMDRSKKCYWVPTTVSRPNTSRLLPMRNLEGWSLSTKASHTERATRNHRSIMCSNHTRHTDNRSSLSSSAASTLFSRWWWSLRTHIMTHVLPPRKNCNYMSLCSKYIVYKKMSTFFGQSSEPFSFYSFKPLWPCSFWLGNEYGRNISQ
jgi:hypothetical protein